MILIIDGDYKENTCHMAGILIKNFEDSEISGFITADTENIGEYESGAFYKREFNGVKTLLDKLNITSGSLGSSVECIVIDGYAKFEDGEHKALGEYIYDKYHIPVIGVAKKKNIFCKITDTEIFRGKSKNPLFITSVGCAHKNAKNCIKRMYGENRIPTIIKLTDSLARKQKIILN